MNKKQVDILLRRQVLLGKIDEQRQQIGEFSQRCQGPIRLFDYAVTAFKHIKQRPLVFAGSLAAFIVYRRGIFGLAKTGWKLWKLYRQSQQIKQHPAFKMALQYFKYKYK